MKRLFSLLKPFDYLIILGVIALSFLPNILTFYHYQGLNNSEEVGQVTEASSTKRKPTTHIRDSITLLSVMANEFACAKITALIKLRLKPVGWADQVRFPSACPTDSLSRFMANVQPVAVLTLVNQVTLAQAKKKIQFQQNKDWRISSPFSLLENRPDPFL